MRIFLSIIIFLLFSIFAEADGASNQLFDALKDNNINSLEKLIASGAKLDQRGEFGETALMQAIYLRNNQAAKMLLKYGSNPNASDMAKVTPLHVAARGGNLEMVRVLIAAGADINALDKYNMTSLMKAVAANRNMVLELLLNHNAMYSNKDVYGYNAISIAKKLNNTKAIQIITDFDNRNKSMLLNKNAINNNIAASTEVVQSVPDPKPVVITREENISAQTPVQSIRPSIEFSDDGSKNIKSDTKSRAISNIDTVANSAKKEANKKHVKVAVRSYKKKIAQKKELATMPVKNDISEEILPQRHKMPKARTTKVDIVEIRKARQDSMKYADDQQIEDLAWLGAVGAHNTSKHIMTDGRDDVSTAKNNIRPAKERIGAGDYTKGIVIKTKRSRVKISRASMVNSDSSSSSKNVNLDQFWLVLKYENQDQNHQDISHVAIYKLQDYTLKYQIVKNLRNGAKYLKIGPINGVIRAEHSCAILIETGDFANCTRLKH